MGRSAQYRLIDLSTGDSAAYAVGSGGVERLDEVDPRAPLVALVPADRCSLVHVDVPAMSAGRLEQALRWAVEDAIAGDPEQQHVVPVGRVEDGRLACLVAAHADMRHWLEIAGERPARLLPDAACVPRREGELALLPHDGDILARGAGAAFDRFEPELLDTIVPELLHTGGEALSPVWLGEPPAHAAALGEPKVRSPEVAPLDALAGAALDAAAAGFDLMRGDYAPRDTSASPRQKRRLAALAAAAGLLLVAGVAVEVRLIERELDRTRQRVEARLTEVFPSITTIVRPRAQAERALAALRGGGGGELVGLLASISPLFAGAAGVEIASLRYAEGRVEIELATPGLADLEALQRQMRSRGLDVELGNVEVRPDRAIGLLTVREARR